jgi:hypothetical protein
LPFFLSAAEFGFPREKADSRAHRLRQAGGWAKGLKVLFAVFAMIDDPECQPHPTLAFIWDGFDLDGARFAAQNHLTALAGGNGSFELPNTFERVPNERKRVRSHFACIREDLQFRPADANVDDAKLHVLSSDHRLRRIGVFVFHPFRAVDDAVTRKLFSLSLRLFVCVPSANAAGRGTVAIIPKGIA